MSDVTKPPGGFREESGFAYDTPAVNGLALPAALLLGLAAHATSPVLVAATAGMWIHEIGHAVVAWLGGFFAVPLPFITIAPSDDRSWLVILPVFAGLVALAVRGYRTRSWGLVAFAALGAALQAFLTASTNPAQAMKWVLFSGLGGEIVLSTVLMLAFYQRLPARWDFWRYPALVTAAAVFVSALLLWTAVGTGTGTMPHGSMVGDESDGDVERLARTYHFTEDGLAGTYLLLARACLAALGLAYGFYLRRALAARTRAR